MSPFGPLPTLTLQLNLQNSYLQGLSYSERNGNKIYMAQALISPEGETLIHRHKLRPSGSLTSSILPARALG